VAIGDIRNIRQNVGYTKESNQKIHQMTSGQARAMIEYKSAKHGMEAAIIDESYSSRTCPKCIGRKKDAPEGRNFVCPKCGFEYHRDGVGAANIRQKQMYQKYVSVVGDMAPPVGLRYRA
jgi:putative transposase